MRKGVSHHEIETEPPAYFLGLMYQVGQDPMLAPEDRLQYAASFSLAYQGAFRINEVLVLMRHNFSVQETDLGGQFFVVESQIEKTHPGLKEVPIPYLDPMTVPLRAWLDDIDGDQVFTKSARAVELRLAKVSEGKVWPHQLRSQRVSYLSSYLTPYELERLGGWGTKPKKAIDHYIHRQWRDYADKIDRAMRSYWERTPIAPEVREWLDDLMPVEVAAPIKDNPSSS